MTETRIVVTPMTEWWHLEHSLQLARQVLMADNILMAQYADSEAVWRRFDKLRAELCHPDAQYYVALMDGGVKGFAGFKTTGINHLIFEFPWCVVNREYQAQGIGRALTETRIEAVKKLGGKLILISTPVPGIYERFGFKTFDHIPGWANHVMSLRLQ